MLLFGLVTEKFNLLYERVTRDMPVETLIDNLITKFDEGSEDEVSSVNRVGFVWLYDICRSK